MRNNQPTNDRIQEQPQVIMRYKVVVSIYDNNGQVERRDEKLFRLRGKAEEYAKDLKDKFNEEKILSFLEVVKLANGVVVQNFKTKGVKIKSKKIVRK